MVLGKIVPAGSGGGPPRLPIGGGVPRIRLRNGRPMDANRPHSAQSFLDVPALLESSLPRARVGLFWYALGGFLLVVLGATLVSRGSERVGREVVALSAVRVGGWVVGV